MINIQLDTSKYETTCSHLFAFYKHIDSIGMPYLTHDGWGLAIVNALMLENEQFHIFVFPITKHAHEMGLVP